MNLIRVTDERDGELVNRGYSANSQVVLRGDRALLFAGFQGGEVRFFEVALRARDVQRHGALLPYGGEGNGWYFDREGWVYLPHGPQLIRANPLTGETSIAMALSDPGRRLWQCHSSDDGRVHSATVERIVSDGPYPREGTLVAAGDESYYFPALGVLDESQITADGAHLIIKEDQDNRVITLATGQERILRDSDGALGHSDAGAGFAIGEADKPEPGQCIYLTLDAPALSWRVLFNTRGLGHVSVRGGRCLLSDRQQLALVDLETGALTPLVEHGIVYPGPPADPYDFQANGNLDNTASVAALWSNRAGRGDLYLLVL